MVTLNKEEVEANEHKTIDHYIGSTRKAPKILEWPLKSAETSNRRIGTKDVKRKEDKRVKIGMEPLITYLKLAKVDYANKIRDPEDCRTRIEVKKDEYGIGDYPPQVLEWYLKYTKSDDPDGQYNLEFWSQNCISRVEDQITKLNSRHTEGENPCMKVQKNLEAVNESENNHIQPEDQFRKTIVRSVDIGSDGVILVSKMVHDEEEDKESSNFT
ncbi:hypothetical protein F8M41_001954 [Gigaspora margarita]|uniref:Uncharacterized protein n=1 Tax=Gigaspora margarita TaxID=4874 RepID=A0A8H3XDJ5_GIGMA|nr:hypothetical protein F8M41_001954 [Gigaspora margarita]